MLRGSDCDFQVKMVVRFKLLKRNIIVQILKMAIYDLLIKYQMDLDLYVSNT